MTVVMKHRTTAAAVPTFQSSKILLHNDTVETAVQHFGVGIQVKYMDLDSNCTLWIVFHGLMVHV